MLSQRVGEPLLSWSPSTRRLIAVRRCRSPLRLGVVPGWLPSGLGDLRRALHPQAVPHALALALGLILARTLAGDRPQRRRNLMLGKGPR